MNIPWLTKPVTLDDLFTYHEPQVPMLAILGNSIAGPEDEYIARNSSASMEDSVESPYVQFHKDKCCGENLEHGTRFRKRGHDRLSQATLAEHRCYPFPLATLTSESDDRLYLLDIIRLSLPNDPLEGHFLKSMTEVDDKRWRQIYTALSVRLDQCPSYVIIIDQMGCTNTG
jgi:hypothetical protein